MEAHAILSAMLLNVIVGGGATYFRRKNLRITIMAKTSGNILLHNIFFIKNPVYPPKKTFKQYRTTFDYNNL